MQLATVIQNDLVPVNARMDNRKFMQKDIGMTTPLLIRLTEQEAGDPAITQHGLPFKKLINKPHFYRGFYIGELSAVLL